MKKRLTFIQLRLRRMFWIIFLITSLSIAGAITMQKLDLFGVEGQELSAYDGGWNFWAKDPQKSKDVALLLVDEKTYSEVKRYYNLEFGNWPYSRNFWAHIIQYLQDCQVKAVVFDVLFTETGLDDASMVKSIASLTKKGIPFISAFDFDVERLALPKVNAVNRWLHQEVSQKIGKKLDEFQQSAVTEGGFQEEPATDQARMLKEKEREKREAPLAAQALAFPLIGHGIELPIPGLAKTIVTDATGKETVVEQPVHPNPPISALYPFAQFGLVSTEFHLAKNQDAKMRYTAFGQCDTPNCFGNLSVVTVSSILKAEAVHLYPGRLEMGSHLVHINQDGTAGINYGGSWKNRFLVYSMFNILREQLQREELQKKGSLLPPGLVEKLKGKVVFIAVAKGDNIATPFDIAPPAVVKHAAEVDSLLNNQFIVDAPYVVSVLIALFLALSSLAIILIIESPYLEIGWPLLLFFGFYIIPGYFLYKYQIHILSVMPSLAGSIASVLASVYKNFFASKERANLKELFGQYMEKEIVEHMVEQHKLPSLSGEEKEITLFFCQIYQFNEQVEKAQLDLKTRATILNLYLNRFTAILKKAGACMDKYVGPEIRAFFGSPVFYKDHAYRACQAALQIKQAEVDLQEECNKQGWPLFSVHIGINTDRVLVGNIGSEELVDYTAIGEGVELASWLEYMNEVYQTSILIGPKTFSQAQDKIQTKEQAPIPEFASQKNILVYELLSLK